MKDIRKIIDNLKNVPLTEEVTDLDRLVLESFDPDHLFAYFADEFNDDSFIERMAHGDADFRNDLILVGEMLLGNTL